MYDTKKLYYEDVYKKEFTAKVLECRESKKGYEIILNQTAFYPEGGGQPSDTGILGGINVKEVHEKDGELVHYTDGPLEVGMDVIGKINWGRRFDLMQQHSGEHIVSGLVHEAFGYDNVGFHMGSDVITIDFSGMLDEEQMAEIEAKANQIIWENQEVEIFYPTEQELKNLKGEKMRMYEEYAAGTLLLDTYKQKKQECDRRISEVQEQIEQSKVEESTKSVVPGTVRAAAEQAENFLNGTRLTASMVSAFIENVFVYDGGRIVVRFKYEQSIQDAVKALHTG